MEPFAAVPEQHEAKRLLTAALGEGDAHAFLFHGPAGVGKTAAAFAFAGAQLGDARRVVERTHPDLMVIEPLGEMIRIKRDRRAPPRSPPAPLRGRPPRVPPARGAPAQRRRGQQAAQGSRGAAALRHDRAGRRHAGPDPRDDPLALPARSRSGGSPSAPCANGSPSRRRSSGRRRQRRSRASPAGASTGRGG